MPAAPTAPAAPTTSRTAATSRTATTASTATVAPPRRAPLPLAGRLAGVVPEVDQHILEPIIADIERLKRERNAVVIAHNYMTPDIFHGVSDLRGDSLQLAKMAAETDADVIVMAGVTFMAETAKILSPDKSVLIPDTRAGCSLADSITGEDVRNLKAQYPGVPVVTYVNTSAEVKAESDITCTSSNALRIVESLGVDRVLFIPDQYLANWVATQTDVEIITWNGACEVHERFTGAQLAELRATDPGLAIIAHPECPPDVLAEADVVGSTSQMTAWVAEHQPARAVLVTECSMADNVTQDAPNTEFVRPCNMCPHMKRITIQNIRTALEEMQHEVTVDPAVATRAKAALDAMLAVG